MSEEHAEEKKLQMGFGSSPDDLTMVFVGGDDGDESGSCWYTRDFDKDKNYPIEAKAITGYITSIVISKSEYKGKANYKLNIRLKADKRYQIRAGINTMFSRGFILAFEEFIRVGGNPKEEPLTIGVRKGNDGKVVFSSLFTAEDNQKIFVDWDGDIALFPIVNKIQEAMGTTVQTKDMIENPEKYKEQRTSQPRLRNQTEDEFSGSIEDSEALADDIFGPSAKDEEDEEEISKPKARNSRKGK